MKRGLVIAFFAFLAGVMLTMSIAAYAANPIKIIVNGKEIKPDVPPQIVNGRTLVPLRAIAEALGANVVWDGNSNTVMITLKDRITASETEQKDPSLTNETSTAQLPTVHLGEKVSINGLDVTITKVDYGMPNFPGKEKGFRIYFSVTNNSPEKLEKAGEFSFKVNPSIYEEEVNRLGYRHYVDNDRYVYPGETATGYYEWYFDKDLEIVEITYYIPNSGIHQYPLAKWIVSH